MRMKMAMSALAVVLSSGSAFAAAPVLIAHRAVYDLELDNASDRSGIKRLAGRMVYEFAGSSCDGYTTSMRMVSQIETEDASKMTDQQTTTFEDGAGKNFSFVTKSFVDQSLDKEIKGNAAHDSKGVEVVLQKPKSEKLQLDPSIFPTQQTIELIERAEKGDTFYSTDLFDGSDQADKVMAITVAVGKQATIPDTDPEKVVLGPTLADDKVWPVDIAYFDADNKADELPEYRISFKLHQNGITRDLTMDYGDFSMKGKLVKLTLLPKSECK